LTYKRSRSTAKSDLFVRWQNSPPKNNVEPKLEKFVKCKECPTCYKASAKHVCKEKDKYKKYRK